MPIRAKGPRLYLRPGEKGRPGTWIIRDGERSVRTGLAAGERGEAEQRLAAFIADKYRPSRARARHPDAVQVADVLNIYLTDRAPAAARPHEVAQRVKALAGFFGTRMLGDINARMCRDYVAARGSQASAKRELEDLRAAVNYHRREGLCDGIVEIAIPAKSAPRDRWLTRDEAARLVRAAWRYREVQKGHATGRRSRRHIARFILVGLYTGTRSTAICDASFLPAIGRGHVDLERGTFVRLPKGKKATKKRQPSIRLPGRLVSHMRRWHRSGVANHAVVEWQGAPISRVSKAFASCVAAAGLGPDVTPHVLRHTAITWAMQNGADLYEASGFFGVTIETLQRVYGHHRPEMGEGVARALQGKR